MLPSLTDFNYSEIPMVKLVLLLQGTACMQRVMVVDEMKKVVRQRSPIVTNGKL